MSKNFEQIKQRPNAAASTKWIVGNSQMAKFSGALGHFQIRYKRGGKIEEIMAKTERPLTHFFMRRIIKLCQNSRN